MKADDDFVQHELSRGPQHRKPRKVKKMPETNKPFFNRRDLAIGTMMGGASLLFGSVASAAPETAGVRGFLDATKLGAVGDGKADDTQALQKSVDTAAKVGGSVFLAARRLPHA